MQVRTEQVGNKQHEGKKLDTDDDNFTHMQPHHIKGRDTKVCVWGDVPDIITHVKFDVVSFRGNSGCLKIEVFH